MLLKAEITREDEPRRNGWKRSSSSWEEREGGGERDERRDRDSEKGEREQWSFWQGDVDVEGSFRLSIQATPLQETSAYARVRKVSMRKRVCARGEVVWQIGGWW